MKDKQPTQNQMKQLMRYKEQKIEKQTNINRLKYRKQYLDSFRHKSYSESLVISNKIYNLQYENIQLTKDIYQQFEYGISVCLYCRTLYDLDQNQKSIVQINKYIKHRGHFLKDLNYLILNQKQRQQDINKKIFKDQNILFIQQKLQLIAAVANICYKLKLPCIEFYAIYQKHIQYVFGIDSYQTSNCYFLIGGYFMQQMQYNKAIACFFKCASLRGKKSGDCFLNIAIIYKIKKNYKMSISMLNQALKSNEQTYGSSSVEVAMVYQRLTLIYLLQRDIQNAVINIEIALKIYNQNMINDGLIKIKILVKKIYSIMKQKLIDQRNYDLIPPDLKELLKDKDILPNLVGVNELEDFQEQKSKRSQDTKIKRDDILIKAAEIEKILKFPQGFFDKLTQDQLTNLAELLIRLDQCKSQYFYADTIGKSFFLNRLHKDRKFQLKQQNRKLFQIISIQP